MLQYVLAHNEKTNCSEEDLTEISCTIQKLGKRFATKKFWKSNKKAVFDFVKSIEPKQEE